MNILEDKNNYKIVGRYIEYNDTLYLSYSASYIEFRVRATEVAVTFFSNGYANDDNFAGCIFIFINDMERPAKHFLLKKGTKKYQLYKADKMQELTIRIMKSSETVFGEVGISKIELQGDVLEFNKSGELIEFVGDSITCGYGFFGKNGEDDFATMQENPWDNYAGKTARALAMDYQLVCWSGNGLVYQNMNYKKDADKGSAPYLQDIYVYSDIQFERKRDIFCYTKWSFDRKPQIIVVNIGTNDSIYTAGNKKREQHFAKEYKAFLEKLRHYNQDAKMICTYGMMEKGLTNVISGVVEEISKSGDDKIFFLELPMQRMSDGYGTDYHPNEVSHNKAAARLIDFIKQINK